MLSERALFDLPGFGGAPAVATLQHWVDDVDVLPSAGTATRAEGRPFWSLLLHRRAPGDSRLAANKQCCPSASFWVPLSKRQTRSCNDSLTDILSTGLIAKYLEPGWRSQTGSCPQHVRRLLPAAEHTKSRRGVARTGLRPQALLPGRRDGGWPGIAQATRPARVHHVQQPPRPHSA